MNQSQYLTLIPLFDVLEGERVLVRPYEEGDAEALFEAVEESREHLRPWMPWEAYHRTIEDSRDFIARSRAHWLLRENMNVSVWRRDDGRYLGGSGLHVRNWDVRYFEIGYWLRASAEGQGYMSETVRLLADFAFEQLSAVRVEIRCDARNARSAGVAERLGFVREARLRNDMLATDGTTRDTLIFSLIPSDPRWPGRP
jgi:RimJ/RimL family protein N-acetyltransferase